MKDVCARTSRVVLAGLWLWGCSGGSAPKPADVSGTEAPPVASQPSTPAEALPPETQPTTVQTSPPAVTSPPEPSSPPASAQPPKPAVPDAPKPVVIAIAGADQHGKTTLLSAMSRALAKRGMGSPRSVEALRSGSGADIGFDSGARRIILRDYPSHQALVSALAKQGSGLGGFILVVALADGITQQTRDQIVAAGKGRQRLLAVAQTKDDLVDDEELKDLEQSEIEQACVDNGLLAEADAGTWVKGQYKPGTRLPFLRVSAKRALEGDAKAEERIAQLATLIIKQMGGAVGR
jgi:hypothetical protein